MNAITMVDDALDALVAEMGRRGIDAQGFNRQVLARLAGVSPEEMSTMLQQYRYAQREEGATRYVLGARQYGRSARWRILAKPGSDPKVVREARREQAIWAAVDAERRVLSDLMHEVYPGLNVQVDAAIANEMDFLTDQMRLIVKRVERQLTNGVAA